MLRLIALIAGSFALACTCCAAAPARQSSFEGAWNVPWCDKDMAEKTCGGFTAYLVQDGDRLCGTHYGSDERQNRMDEGEPRSISGSVVGSTAVLAIRSGRNHAIFLVRATRKSGSVAWKTLDTLVEGDNGEPAFVPDRDLLRRDTSADALKTMKTVAEQCRESR